MYVWMVNVVARTRECYHHYKVAVVTMCMWWEDGNDEGLEE